MPSQTLEQQLFSAAPISFAAPTNTSNAAGSPPSNLASYSVSRALQACSNTQPPLQLLNCDGREVSLDQIAGAGAAGNGFTTSELVQEAVEQCDGERLAELAVAYMETVRAYAHVA